VRLTPIQRDILWAVEEAGQEELQTVWVTVRPDHDLMSDDEFRIEFVEGLLGITRLGYVRLLHRMSTMGRESRAITKQETQRLWTDAVQQALAGIYVEMTDAGYAALGEPGASFQWGGHDEGGRES
jgi:hypothetical protein